MRIIATAITPWLVAATLVAASCAAVEAPSPGACPLRLLTALDDTYDLLDGLAKRAMAAGQAEDAITGGGLLLMYRAIAEKAAQNTPEEVLQAALAGNDAAAVKTLDQFIIWLARIAGDAAMTMQARGGVYLAGGIAPSIVEKLKTGPFRTIFQEKGRLAQIMRPIPVYVIVDKFPAFKGCAAAIAAF